MNQYPRIRRFIKLVIFVCLILMIYVVAHAKGEVPAPPDDGVSSKDVILYLLALLQTIMLGFAVWLIGNDRELFKRVSSVETRQEVRDKLCEERNIDGDHHKRASDVDPYVALKESVDMLRRALWQLGVPTPAPQRPDSD